MSFDLSRRNVLMGGFALLAGCGPKTPETPQAELPSCPAMRQEQLDQNGTMRGQHLGGSLRGLIHNGQIFNDARDGFYRLVYFGTAHRIPGCENDLMSMQAALEMVSSDCAAADQKITPFFVYPDLDESYGLPANVQDIEQSSSGFVNLHGTLEQIKHIARGYAAMYVERNGRVESHTRNIYLMAPDGKNIANFKIGTSSYIIAQQIIRSIGDRGQLFKIENTPGATL